MRRRIVTVSVAVATFVAGVLTQLLGDRLTNSAIDTPTRIVAFSLGGLTVVVVILAIIVSFGYLDHIQQSKILADKVDDLTRRFGLSVEFVPDRPGVNEGLTYERMRDLVAQAEQSLVFVDFYAESGSYYPTQGIARDRRHSYYGEILAQIEARIGHEGQGVPFHRRIIQAGLHEAGGKITLAGDDAYISYLRQCLVHQETSPRATVLKVCPQLVPLHFAVIDHRHVILPILTFGPRDNILRRHGALIFEDRVGDLVSRLMNIYDILDATARPLAERHLEQ